ncbi:hypothetical protein [Mesorhizobium amorphae]|uniref:hypothetical protein n=1 Tax=Mesorhizobium amorphae TaxID=71433 RepID=UPI0024E18950|nr:hypothetical protein [Mesorhizobium amorphae]
MIFAASWLSLGDAESFFKIVESKTARVVIEADIEKRLSILNLEKPPFTHHMPGALSSRTGEKSKLGALRWQSTGIGCCTAALH